MNTSDEDVGRFLKLFTLLDLGEIEKIIHEHSKDPSARHGQRTLAHYVIQTIFGKKAVDAAEKITEVLFGAEDKLTLLTSMSEHELDSLRHETGGITLETLPMNICDAIVATGLESSKGNAKKAVEAGSIYLNEQKIEKIDHPITEADLLNGKVSLLRKGKKSFKLLTK